MSRLDWISLSLHLTEEPKYLGLWMLMAMKTNSFKINWRHN